MRGLIYLESLSLIVSSFSAFLVHCLTGVNEIPNTKFQFLPLSLIVWFLGEMLWLFGSLGMLWLVDSWGMLWFFGSLGMLRFFGDALVIWRCFGYLVIWRCFGYLVIWRCFGYLVLWRCFGCLLLWGCFQAEVHSEGKYYNAPTKL